MTRAVDDLRRVVIVARDFPPAGGAPAIRITKLVKYLPRFGWRATVVTVPADHAWTRDESLMAELPVDLAVHRVPRLLSRAVAPTDTVARAKTEVQPSWIQRAATLFLVPDRSILWALPAVQRVRRLVHHADALLTTGPPFSTHLIGLWSAGASTPWIADFRDNWTTNPDYEGRMPLRAVNRVLERAVLRRADAVLAVSPAARVELASVLLEADARIVVAANGYDRDDLPPRAAGPPTRFSLVYAGSLRATRDPRPLFGALQRLIDQEPGLGDALELHLLGTIPDSAVTQARASLGPKRVRVHGFVAHRAALAQAARAAVLVAISSEAEAGGSALTSKLIEYIAIGRPVLYLAPPGPGVDLVQKLDAGEVANPHETDAIAAAVTRLYARWRSGREQAVAIEALGAFDRLEMARIVAERLEMVAAERATRQDGR